MQGSVRKFSAFLQCFASFSCELGDGMHRKVVLSVTIPTLCKKREECGTQNLSYISLLATRLEYDGTTHEGFGLRVWCLGVYRKSHSRGYENRHDYGQK